MYINVQSIPIKENINIQVGLEIQFKFIAWNLAAFNCLPMHFMQIFWPLKCVEKIVESHF